MCTSWRRFSDFSGADIAPGQGAALVVYWLDARPARLIDLSTEEAEEFSRLGRRLDEGLAAEAYDWLGSALA